MKDLIEFLNGETRDKLLSDDELEIIYRSGIINFVKPDYEKIHKYFKPVKIEFSKEKYAAYPLEFREITRLCEQFNIIDHRDNLYFIIHHISYDQKVTEESATAAKQFFDEFIRLEKLLVEIIKDYGNSIFIEKIFKDYILSNNLHIEKIPRTIKGNNRKLDLTGLYIEQMVNKLSNYLESEVKIEQKNDRYEIIAQILEIAQNKEIILDRKQLKAAREHIQYKLRVS